MIYRYNVIVEVGIDTNKLNAGNRQAQAGLRNYEREAIESQRRVTDAVDRDIAKQQRIVDQGAANRTRTAKAENAELFKAMDERNDRLRSSMLRAQAERVRIQNQEAENERNVLRQNVTASIDAARRRVEAKSFEVNQVEKLNERIRQSDPFQNLGSRSIPLSSASRAVRDEEIKFQRAQDSALSAQILAKDPFQNLGSRQVSLGQAAKDIKEVETRTREFEKSVKDADKALASSQKSVGLWGQAFKGAFVGAVAGLVFSVIIGGIFGIAGALKDAAVGAVEVAASFEKTRNAMTVFTGSTFAARKELGELDQLARTTPGLRLEDAEAGAVRLRALGFEAKTVQDLVVGLAKQKLLSGADESQLNRVIVNITQLASGSPRLTQDIKEMIQSFPTLRLAIGDTFGSIEKFKTALRDDPEKALEKFAKGIKDTQVAAPGLEDAMSKLKDEVIRTGREFGEPILDPLTVSVKNLTGFLTENKDVWRDWGQYVGDIIEGLNAKADERARNGAIYRIQQEKVAKESFLDKAKRDITFTSESQIPVTEAEIQEYLSRTNKGGKVSTFGFLDNLAEEGRKRRLKERPKFEIQDIPGIAQDIYGLPSGYLKSEGYANVPIFKDDVTSPLRDKAAERKRIEAEQRARVKELAQIDDHYKKIRAVRESAFSVNIAQNEENAQRVYELTINNFDRQIKEETAFYARKIELSQDDVNEVFKLESERDSKLTELRAQKQIETIKFQREQEKEQRRSLIEFNNLQIETVRFGAEERNKEIKRSLDLEKITTEKGYDDLLTNAKDSYEQIRRLTTQNYVEQLKDRSLTAGQYKNLEEKYFQDLTKLQADYNQNVLDINRARYDAEIKDIQTFTEQQLNILSSFSENVSGFSFFGEIENIVNAPKFNILLDKAKELKTVFETNNQSLSTFFKSRSDYYKNLENAAQKELEVQQRIRSRMLPSETPKSQIVDAATGQVIGEANTVSEDTNNRISETDKLIEKLKDDVLQYSGIAKNFGNQAQEAAQYALGITENYGKLQSRVFELYDSLQKGTGDFTVFDEIIEKSYLAERELGKSQLQVKLDGLTQQLTKADKALKDGVISPVEFAGIKTQVNDAEQALKAYNFETEKGRQSLDLLTNAREKYEKLRSGDAGAVAFERFKSEVSLYRDLTNQLSELYNLEFQIQALKDGNFATEYDNLQIEIALRKDILSIRNEETDAIIRGNRARLEIANQGVFSKNKADADLLEFFAKQKGVTEILSDARINLITQSYNGLDKVIGKLTDRFGVFGDVIKDVLSSLIKLALNKVFQTLFFGNGAKGGNAQSGGGFGGIGNILFGGGSGGGFGGFGGVGGSFPNVLNFGGFSGNSFGGFTPDLARAAAGGFGSSIEDQFRQFSLAQYGEQSAGLLRQGGNGVASTLLSGGGLAAGIGGFLPLLGASLGAGLGGQSTGGQILGGLGGLLGGLAGFGLLAPTAFAGAIGSIGGALGLGAGSIATLAGALPIVGLVAAPLLLLGSYFLGRNKQRKADEKARTQYLSDAFRSMDELIDNVKNDRIDGATALSQAEQIRKNYLDQAGQLKDKKTRNIALKDVSRIDQKISILKSEVDAQISRQKRLEQSVPTFYDGGEMSAFGRKNFVNNPLGYQNRPPSFGYFPGADMVASFNERGNEFIFDAQTTRNIGVHNLNMMLATKGQTFNALVRQSNIPRKDTGGLLAPTRVDISQAQNSAPASSDKIEVTVNVGLALEQFIEIIAQKISANDGSRTQIRDVVGYLKNNAGGEEIQQLKRLLGIKTE